MTLTIRLGDDEAALLLARAEALGLTAESYARMVLENDLRIGSVRPPILAAIREIWRDMPEAVRAKLPDDGASQLDHYVYGLPKRELGRAGT